MVDASVLVKSLGLGGGIGASITCAEGPTAEVRLDETSVEGGKASSESFVHKNCVLGLSGLALRANDSPWDAPAKQGYRRIRW